MFPKRILFIIALFFVCPAPGGAAAIDDAPLAAAIGLSRSAQRAADCLKRAAACRTGGDTAGAIEVYRKALEEDMAKKDRYTLLIALGDTYLSEQQYAHAIEAYQEAAVLLPRLEEAHLRLAGVYEASELTELARQEYLTVLSLNRKSFDAYCNLATIYRKEGLTTQAMEYYRRALTLKPCPAVYRSMSQCAELTGDVMLALALLKQIPPDERTFEDLLRMGQLFRERKRHKDAEEAFSQAIKLAPEKVEGYILLSLLYLEDNDLTPAENLLQIALEKSPGEGMIRFFLGYIYHRQQKSRQAEAEIREAQRLSRTEILKRYSAKFADFMSATP